MHTGAGGDMEGKGTEHDGADGDLMVQRPVEGTGPDELVLLLHGVGSRPEDLRPLGAYLAAQRPRAWVVSLRSPDRSDFGAGWQWFSVQGISEANRPPRVAAAMPVFLAAVARWQSRTGAPPARTTLIGFSQGAIMALESTQAAAPVVAARLVAIAGRFAQAPRAAVGGTIVHLMHGEQDRVMPVHLATQAVAQLGALGMRCTLDLFPGLGHGIDGHVAQRILERLQPGE